MGAREITVVTLLILLTLHFIGDFVFQSDRVATGKSKSFRTLLWHVSIYTLTFLPFIVAIGDGPRGAEFLAWTFAFHLLVDSVTSRLTSRLWFIEFAPRHPEAPFPYFARILPTRHWFFVAIGFDQLLHVWALAIVWMWCYA